MWPISLKLLYTVEKGDYLFISASCQTLRDKGFFKVFLYCVRSTNLKFFINRNYSILLATILCGCLHTLLLCICCMHNFILKLSTGIWSLITAVTVALSAFFPFFLFFGVNVYNWLNLFIVSFSFGCSSWFDVPETVAVIECSITD